LLGGEGGAGDAGEADDFHAHLEDEFLEVLGAFAFEELEGFDDFEAGADGVLRRDTRANPTNGAPAAASPRG